MKELSDLTIEELKSGFRFDEAEKKYICNICGNEFNEGEIYKINDRFFEAAKAISIHIITEHESVFDFLLSLDSKYLSITDNQQQLLSLIKSGLSDNEIAKQTGVTPSTIRHQKFMFREKAKQAKMYLAIYELSVPQKQNDKLDTTVIHSGAKMVDDRYITTQEEREKIIFNAFISLSPLKLQNFSAKEKKKLVILSKISEQFEKGKHYSENELNQILKDIYEDYATIRRYLIEYGFMNRTNDCKEYWLK